MILLSEGGRNSLEGSEHRFLPPLKHLGLEFVLLDNKSVGAFLFLGSPLAVALTDSSLLMEK